MKNNVILLACLLVFILNNSMKGNGIAYSHGENPVYLDIITTDVSVRIDNQVSITTVNQTFLNTSDQSTKIRYAFPLQETSSATSLRYKIGDTWYSAAFAAVPQDSIAPGQGCCGPNQNLHNYLGSTPIIYDVDTSIAAESTITIEFAYVELLPYKLGQVNYTLPFGVANLMPEEKINCRFHLTVYSQRTIDGIYLTNPTSGEILENNYIDSASIDLVKSNFEPYDDIEVSYSLATDELGLFSLSSYVTDSIVPDDLGNGFFTFIVEPEPQTSDKIISKYFTLIIDRSGSMSGTKIVDARNAANFIIEHLNDDDHFNIVSFSSDITSFKINHVSNTSSNRSQAYEYIKTLGADGSTNISGAFDEATPQFSATSPNSANIIIFLTDGEQTSGITETGELINHINNQIVQSETDINLFSFGIGEYTNERLLRTISYDNNGISVFLANNELESVITEFFLLINNPVLLETALSINPKIITEIFPVKLPNLYIGQQMIISGRYSEPAPFELILSGKAFSNPIEYSYSPTLANKDIENNRFLMKIWAKQKIESRLNEYYKNFADTSISNPLKKEITQISLNYGVISPFTSFRGVEEDVNGSFPTSLAEAIKKDPSEIIVNEYISDLKVLGGQKLEHTFLSFNYNHNDLKSGRFSIINQNGQIMEIVDLDFTYGHNIVEISEWIKLLPKGLYIITLNIDSSIISTTFIIR